MIYRREIDGLRAVAVVPVILFHAGLDSFGGGFVGVDVFFVISGYLITTIILAELDQGRFSLMDFYERRARRILPALFVVMLSCIPFAWIWLLPSELKDFSQSLVAVSAFASNLLFWRESGYFDTAAELKPLLHTWSLAVEEQYYLLFPVFLIVVWRLGRRWVLILLGLAFSFSLAIAQWAVYAEPEAAFYLLPARGWEILVGAFAAFYLSRRSIPHSGKGPSEVGACLGIGLILASVVFYSKTTPFPGLNAIVPTLGTVLVILFADQRTWVGRVLGVKALVGLGLISYSAYLWHQPLFAFARHRSPTEPGDGAFLLLAAAALILAYGSWKYVETPFRNRELVNRRTLVVFSTACAALVISAGVVGIRNDGFPDRLPPNIAWESFGQKLAASGDVCEFAPLADFPGVNACSFGSETGDRAVILYGDSHAQAIGSYLGAEFSKAGIEGIRAELEGCHVVPGIVEAREAADRNRGCAEKLRSLVSFAKSRRADIVLSSRWSFRLYPVNGHIEDMPYRNSEGGVEAESYREYAVAENGKLDFGAQAKQGALKALVDGLLEADQRLFLIYPVPEIGWNIARTNWNHFLSAQAVLEEISIPFDDFRSRNSFVIQIFDSFIGRENFYPVRPSDELCNSFIENRCVAQYKSIPYYHDDDHLSDAGAKLVVDTLLENILRER